MSWTRSLLKYPGGKYSLLDCIDRELPRSQIDLYVEPFLGGASVALNIGRRYPRMILNDANADIINFWTQIADNHTGTLDELERLIGKLYTTPSKDVYLAIRECFNLRNSSEHLHAAMFYFLNKQGFNGLVRYNLKGEFNVPHGKYKRFPSISYEHVQEASDIFSNNTQLHSLDWHAFFKKIVIPKVKKNPNVFMYIDPPYIPVSKTSNFTSYWMPFDVEQHKKLRASLDKLTELNVKWMMSNSKTEETESIFTGYNFIEVKVPRNISCKGNGRGSITEYLITNYKQ
jgi:DNA adenine methylase